MGFIIHSIGTSLGFLILGEIEILFSVKLERYFSIIEAFILQLFQLLNHLILFLIPLLLSLLTDEPCGDMAS